MAYCRNCGHDVGSGAKFCPECGQDQNVAVPQDQRIPTEKIPVPPLPPPSSSSAGAARKPRMTLGRFLVVAFLGIAVLAALIGVGDEEEVASDVPATPVAAEAASEEAPSADPPAQVAPPPQPPPEPAPVELSGTGQTATERFRLEPGLAIASMSYQGESNFIVEILGGVAGINLANAIGSFEGSQAIQVGGGEYMLDVQASGPWTITFEQPRPATAPYTTNFNGAGKTATDLFRLPQGVSTLELEHQGGSNFIVDLLDKNGVSVGMGLVNEIGPFQGSTTVRVPKDDVYLLQVEADGPWTIEVQ